MNELQIIEPTTAITPLFDAFNLGEMQLAVDDLDFVNPVGPTCGSTYIVCGSTYSSQIN